MAASEQGVTVPLSKKVCNYCKNSTKSGPICSACGLSYHPSCGQRVKVCCGLELQTKCEDLSVANSSNLDLLYLKEENKLLHQIISDKEIIINDKNSIINLLQQKIVLLEDKLKDVKQTVSNKNPNNEGSTSKQKNQDNTEKHTFADKVKINSQTQKQLMHNKNFDKKDNSNLKLLQDKQRDIMNSVINLDPENNEKDLNKEAVEWKTVKPKGKSSRIKKLGEVENTGNFKGLNPKVWMYIYRVVPEVTEDDIKEYLAKKTGDEKTNFTAKLIKTTKSNLKCFMVAADFKFKEDFYSGSFWPKGVGYRRFNFITDNIPNEQAGSAQPNSFL